MGRPTSGSRARQRGDRRRVPREPRDRGDQVRRVPRHELELDAVGVDPLARRHRQPGAAAARAARGRGGPPTRSIRSATARCATSTRSSSRSCCSASAACSRLRGRREAAPSARARERAGGRSACSSARWCWRRCRSAPASHEANEVRPAGESWWQFIRHTKSPDLPVVLLEDLGRARRPRDRAGRRRARRASPATARWDGVGSLAIGVLLIVVAIVLVIEMGSLLVGEAARPEVVARIRAASGGHRRCGAASICAPSTSAPTRSSSRQGRVRPDTHRRAAVRGRSTRSRSRSARPNRAPA